MQEGEQLWNIKYTNLTIRFLLYQEFMEIPGNTFKFRLPEGMILTTEMMHTFLRAAYMSVGRMDLPS